MTQEMPIISVVPPAEEFYPGSAQSNNPMLFLTTDAYPDAFLADSHHSPIDSPDNHYPLASGQMSPLVIDESLNGLRDGGSNANNLFLTDVGNNLVNFRERNPSETWSPISTSSGDVFPDSDYSYSPGLYPLETLSPSYPASPSLSPSISPIEAPFNNFTLSDTDDHNGFVSSRRRDRSPSVGGRSLSPLGAGFTFTFENADSPYDNAVAPNGQWGNNLSLGLEFNSTSMDGSELQYANDTSSLTVSNASSHRPRSASLGGQVNFSELSDSQSNSHAHGDFLTVPNSQLQRRQATHRRNHTTIGINAGEGAGRGRSLGVPAHFASSRPHSLGRINESGNNLQRFQGIQIQTNLAYAVPSVDASSPGTPYSSSSSNYSPSFDTPATPSDHSPITPGSPYSTPNDNILSPHDVGLARRSSESIPHSPRMDGGADLFRHTSDSTGLRRSKSRSNNKLGHRRVRSGNYDAFTSVFKNNKSTSSFTSSSSADLGSPYDSYAPDYQAQIALPHCELGTAQSQDEQDFRATVASDKIVAAAEKRRIHQARFACDICPATFTARHNLNNHMNSHTGEKPFKCQFCGQAAVTQAVVIRHERNSCKLRNKLKGKKASH